MIYMAKTTLKCSRPNFKNKHHRCQHLPKEQSQIQYSPYQASAYVAFADFSSWASRMGFGLKLFLVFYRLGSSKVPSP